MIENLGNKIFLEVFKGKMFLPFILGASFVVTSPAFGFVIGFLGCCLLLVSAGVGLSDFILNKEKIVESILKQTFQEEKNNKQKSLVVLQKNLTKTIEVADDAMLRDLQSIYYTFLDDISNQKLVVHQNLMDQVVKLFEACVKSIEYSFDLHEQQKSLSPLLAKRLKLKRKRILSEVDKNVHAMFDLVSQIRISHLDAKDNTKQMESIRKQVDRSLQLAKELEALNTEDDGYDEYIENK